LCLARYDVHIKGLDRLAEIARYSPSLRVVVHGQIDPNADPGSIARLVSKAPSNFELSPAVFDDDKWRRLSQAQSFVQLSRAEGLSLALIEAMAMGVPCVVSAEVGATLPHCERSVALIVDDDMRVAADQIGALLLDDERLAQLSRAAIAFVDDRLSPAKVAGRLEATYEHVLGSERVK
jgi:glycosyltransferase involved in cell wall biosynthesis